MASIIKGVLISIFTTGALFAAPTLDDLTSKISEKILDVPEFSELAEQAEKHGLKVFVMGGLASSFSFFTLKHLEKADQSGKPGSPEFASSQSQSDDGSVYQWNNIFWPSQDIDLAIARNDGRPETEDDFRKITEIANSVFRNKKVDIFGFQTSRDNRPSIFESEQLQNQNSDSVSSGLIELTGKHEIIDFRDTNLGFLKSLLNKKIEFFRSPSHHQTDRAKKGQNPEILSVIRFYINSIRYSLEPIENGSVQEIIEAFAPKKIDSNYVTSWIANNAKKLVTQANDFDFLSRFKKSHASFLRKLLQISKNTQEVHSLAWYLTRDLLTSDPEDMKELQAKFKVTGKTAKDLGIKEIAHSTKDLQSYLQITHSQSGWPNFFISKNDDTQAAMHGNGVYFLKGDRGAGLKGYHIIAELLPDAQEGIDFAVVQQNIVIVFNRQKIYLINNKESNFESLISRALSDENPSMISADLEIMASRMNMRHFSPAQIYEIKNAFFKIGFKRGYFNALKFLNLFSEPELVKFYRHIVEAGQIRGSKKSSYLLLKSYSFMKRLGRFSPYPFYNFNKAKRWLKYSMLVPLLSYFIGVAYLSVLVMKAPTTTAEIPLAYIQELLSGSILYQLQILGLTSSLMILDVTLAIANLIFSSPDIEVILNAPRPGKSISPTTYACLRLVRKMKWFKESSRSPY